MLLLAIALTTCYAAYATDGGVGDCGGAGLTTELTIDSLPRCFQMYTPASVSKPMPVIVFFHGKGGRASASCSQNADIVKHADSLGYALVCGDAYEDWQFPKVGATDGVTSANPRPCSAQDTPDATYVAKILERLQSDTSTYDIQKIYFMGFSQGSMMTTWASTCFADKIRGTIQAGSGIKLHGGAVTTKFCAASANSNKCKVGDDDGVGIPGGSGKCDTCEYFPLQPAKLNNVIGEPLRWCLYMGCDDYLAHSVNNLAVYLDSIGAPYNLEFYDGAHVAPGDWMTKADPCHGIWSGGPTNNSGITCSSESFFVSGSMGSNTGGTSPSPPAGGSPTACTEQRTTLCCGDGTCGGPETEDNCALDCSGTATPTPAPSPPGGTPPSPPGGGSPPACTAQRTTLCCGDGTCGGPETKDNCASDCSGTVAPTPAPNPPGGTPPSPPSSGSSSTSKYPLVGCKDTSYMKTLYSNVEPTVAAVERCLDGCKDQGYVFGGLTCPGNMVCKCFKGAPSENYWAAPHHVRFSNQPEACVGTSTSCPGPTKVGQYYVGSADAVSMYGLEAANLVTTGLYTPVAVIPTQPSIPSVNTGCTQLRGELLSSLNGRDLVIPPGSTYHIDQSREVDTLTIAASATLAMSDQAGITLSAKSILVEGTLQLGTRSCPLVAGRDTSALPSAGIVLRGARKSQSYHEDKGIVVKSGGVLDVHGYPFAPTWTRLKRSAAIGATALELRESVNWEVGQEVVIVTTTHVDDRGDHQNEIRKLVAVSGTSITLDAPLSYFHYGGEEYQAEVGLLSRSILIQGDDLSDNEEYGGHIMCLAGSTCRLSYARGYRMGQKNIVGRYPFHFHLMGNVTQQSYFEGLAVQDSYFRAFVIHGTSNSIVSRCVAFNITGSALYLEDGMEEENLIQYNLIAHVLIISPYAKPWVEYDWKQSATVAVETVPDRVVPTDLTAAAFYCTNPNNRWVGNSASGGFSGFLFPMTPKVLGFSYAGNENYSPVEQRLLEFDGNVCHSSGQWFKNGACIYAGGTIKNLNGNASHYWYWYWKFGSEEFYRGHMSLSNTKIFASRAGLKSWGLKTGMRPAVHLKNTEFHDNMLGLAFFGHNQLDNAIISSHTANAHAYPTYVPSHGFQTYDTLFQSIFNNVSFRGYKGLYDIALYSFAVSDCCSMVGLLGHYNLSFVDVPWEKRFQLNPGVAGKGGLQWANDLDLDGTLTDIKGGAILGAGDGDTCFSQLPFASGGCGTSHWWQIDETCKLLFKASGSPGLWACPRQSPKAWSQQFRTIVSVILTRSSEISCSGGNFPYFNTGPFCTRYVSDTEKLLVGTVYHFGHQERRASIGWTSEKAGRLITGSCCDVGWYLVANGTAPRELSIVLEQMVPTGGLVLATTYPATAAITVQKCQGGKSATVCADLVQTENKTMFLDSPEGTAFMIDKTNNTVFLKLVNSKNIWFGEERSGHILASDFHWQARYIVRSTVSGAAPMKLPPEDWVDDGRRPLQLPSATAPTPAPVNSPTSSPMPTLSPAPLPTLSPAPAAEPSPTSSVSPLSSPRAPMPAATDRAEAMTTVALTFLLILAMAET